MAPKTKVPTKKASAAASSAPAKLTYKGMCFFFLYYP